jgi:demethylmenaquinone methyltransferase/2-methoxy-6-polyprenyl-1,4-benzoquinol methylase
VAALRRPAAGAAVVDLMAGGAELWPVLRRRFGPALQVTAVDFSAPMLARALAHGAGPALTLHVADALATGLPAAQAAAVTCAFGLKTLPPTAYQALADEAARLLRPGGQVALVEFVLPPTGWQRRFALGYLATLLPVLGQLFPATADHAELPRYASTGPDLAALRQALRQAGLGPVRQRRLWPGCAVLLTAEKRA